MNFIPAKVQLPAVPATGSGFRPLSQTIPLLNGRNKAIGGAFTCTGACETSTLRVTEDRTYLSAIAESNHRHLAQRVAMYLADFRIGDDIIKVAALADGMGPMTHYPLVSSSFILGVKLAVEGAAKMGAIPSAQLLYDAGRAVWFHDPDAQKLEHGTSATVFVLHGNVATLASAGDSLSVLLRPDKENVYQVAGYAEPSPHHPIHVKNFLEGPPRLYSVNDVRGGDQFVIGNASMWQQLLGMKQFLQLSKFHRLFELNGDEFIPKRDSDRPPSQATFDRLLLASNQRSERIMGALNLYQVARLIQYPQKHRHCGGMGDISGLRDPDNLATIVCHIEELPMPTQTPEVPQESVPLEPIPLHIST